MLLTADHDDRVVPLHSLKLLAVSSVLVVLNPDPSCIIKLQLLLLEQTMQHVLSTSLEKSPQSNPIIGRIECKAGHGAGRPTKKMVA